MKRLILTLQCILILLTAAAQSDKEKIELGLQKFNAGKQLEAYKILFSLSNSKYFNAEAEYCMGDFYNGGVNSNEENIYLRSDEEIAIKWFKKAANHDNVNALVSLGNIYSRKCVNGNNKKYTKEAIKWYTKAVEKGSCGGFVSLGDAYKCGYLGPKDYNESYKWSRMAADKGCDFGILSVAQDYANGYGVTKDIKEAVNLYLSLLNKEGGNNYLPKNAIYSVCTLLESSKPINIISENEEIAILNKGCKLDVNSDAFYLLLLKNKDSNNFNDTALNKLGNLYEDGKLTTSNFNEALKYFKKAAEMGLSDAQYNLANYISVGLAATKNDKEAFGWYLKAAIQGNVAAQRIVGYNYQNAIGIAKNNEEAAKWFSKAADQGDVKAQYYLALAYKDGIGVEKNHTKSQRLIANSSSKGYKAGDEFLDENIAMKKDSEKYVHDMQQAMLSLGTEAAVGYGKYKGAFYNKDDNGMNYEAFNDKLGADNIVITENETGNFYRIYYKDQKKTYNREISLTLFLSLPKFQKTGAEFIITKEDRPKQDVETQYNLTINNKFVARYSVKYTNESVLVFGHNFTP